MHTPCFTARLGRFSLFIPMIGGCVLGCSETTTIPLKDTEDREVTLTCKGKTCRVARAPDAHPSAPQPEGTEPAFVVHQASRLYGVCETWVRGGIPQALTAADCRPITCTRDEDCPPAIGMPKGACTHGLCIEPTGAITSDDAVMLCLAGTGAPSGSSNQIERFAMGSNCGSPCVVPSVCRQP